MLSLATIDDPAILMNIPYETRLLWTNMTNMTNMAISLLYINVFINIHQYHCSSYTNEGDSLF